MLGATSRGGGWSSSTRGRSRGLEERFAARQEGVVGDITASRRVKVPDIPIEEIGDYYAAKKPFPWHWGNSLYLEWYGARNGRVVIKTTDYMLTIVGEATWEMTAEEEQAQQQANGEALTGFMARLTEAVERLPGEVLDATPAEWDEESAPQTEAEAEEEQARMDLLLDRVQARLEREGAGADYEKILDEERARLRRERREPEPEAGDEEESEALLDEMHRAAEEALDDPDAYPEQRHPLSVQARELALEAALDAEELGWVTEGASEEHPVNALVEALSNASAKLAGALDGRDWPPPRRFCAHTIVQLKRARGYLADAVTALESCQEQRLIPVEHLGVLVVGLADLAAHTDSLIGATAGAAGRRGVRIDRRGEVG